MLGNKTPGNLGYHKQRVRACVTTRTPLAMVNPTAQKAFTVVSRYWWEPGRISAGAFISEKNKSFSRWARGT